MPQPETGNPWKPTLAIRASWALHAGAAVTLVARPNLWPWALGAIVVDHIVLTAAGLWPRSTLLGPNWTRLPEPAANAGSIAITIDDGPDPIITPRVLDVLDQHGAKATFFCIGELVQEHTQLAREIVNRGHSIENHSQRHRHTFSVMGPNASNEMIIPAMESMLVTATATP